MSVKGSKTRGWTHGGDSDPVVTHIQREVIYRQHQQGSISRAVERQRGFWVACSWY